MAGYVGCTHHSFFSIQGKWVKLCGSLIILWHCLSLRLKWKTDLFQSCGHCRDFQICWRIEYSTFTATFFRIWNSSTGIPSHPLALIIVMIPKAHLTSHSRMSGSSWVVTLSWLSGSWRSFCMALLCIDTIFAWNVPLVSLISLKRSLVFPILLFSSIFLHSSLRKTFLFLLAILFMQRWNR